MDENKNALTEEELEHVTGGFNDKWRTGTNGPITVNDGNCGQTVIYCDHICSGQSNVCSGCKYNDITQIY